MITKVSGQAGARKSPQFFWRSGFIGAITFADEILIGPPQSSDSAAVRTCFWSDDHRLGRDSCDQGMRRAIHGTGLTSTALWHRQSRSRVTVAIHRRATVGGLPRHPLSYQERLRSISSSSLSRLSSGDRMRLLAIGLPATRFTTSGAVCGVVMRP